MYQGQMLTTIFILLFASIVFVPLTKRFGLSSILGYLLAGMVIGPSALNIVHDVENISKISEFGIVLFMFLIGLELRPTILHEMKRDIISYGFLQVILTGLVFSFITWYTTQNILMSVLLGMSFALSSTALGIQVLQEKKYIKSRPGRASLAVLLFQDIAIIPMMAIISILSGMQSGASAHSAFDLVAVTKMFFAIFFTVILGKYFLKYLFRFIAKTQLREIFTAVSLLLIIGIALLMESVGLSMAFGSFLAGILMADSEFRYELEINIEPFKGLLMGLFFMAVGMSMDLGLLLTRPVDIMGLAVVITLIKCSVLFLISSFFRLNFHERLIFTIATSQIGEFGFVLLGLGSTQGIIANDQASLFGLVIALSMAMTPLLFLFYEKIYPLVKKKNAARAAEQLENENQVIIAGFGRFGTIVARILHANNIITTVLDNDPNQVDLVRKFGFTAYYGDVSRLDMLEAAGGGKAKILVVAVDDMASAEETVIRVKQHFPNLKIFVRCRSRNDYFTFKALGVDVLIRDTFGSALEMGGAVLRSMGYGAFESLRILKRFREHDEKYLDDSYLYHQQEDTLVSLSKKARFELERTLKNDQKWMSQQRYWES